MYTKKPEKLPPHRQLISMSLGQISLAMHFTAPTDDAPSENSTDNVLIRKMYSYYWCGVLTSA